MDHQRNIITPSARKFVFTRRLPTTGQTVSYQDGDDGDYEAGWSIHPPFPGGRFLFKTLSGDQVVVDRATGLMWPRYASQAGGNFLAVINWSDAIIYCEALNFAGFTDWRMPNVLEYFTMYNHGRAGPINVPRDWMDFYLDYRNVWTSTTLPLDTSFAWVISLGEVTVVKTLPKTDLIRLLAVREIC